MLVAKSASWAMTPRRSAQPFRCPFQSTDCLLNVSMNDNCQDLGTNCRMFKVDLQTLTSDIENLKGRSNKGTIEIGLREVVRGRVLWNSFTSRSELIRVSVPIYTDEACTSIDLCIYIYIYIERERERYRHMYMLSILYYTML